MIPSQETSAFKIFDTDLVNLWDTAVLCFKLTEIQSAALPDARQV